MRESAKTVCLNMIVRNEAHCIARCLASVRPVISYWVICDTGSSDGTQDTIRNVLREIPGELHNDPWRDFASNRNLGLARANGKADYHLILDADFTVNIRSEWDPLALQADGYRLGFEGEIDWTVTRLVSDQHEWRYRGRAHEYLHSATAKTLAHLPSITLNHHADGGSRPGRLERYLDLLLQDHAERPDDERTAFYIAQTYFDLERYPEAIEWYERRLAMGKWEEEQWYSAYMMTRGKQLLGLPWPEILQGYLECYEMRPWRLEPLQRICEYHRQSKHYELNYLLSRPALDTPYPKDDLIFIERPVYRYGLLMERALAAFWTQRFDEAQDLLNRVVGIPDLPANYRRSASSLLRRIGRVASTDMP